MVVVSRLVWYLKLSRNSVVDVCRVSRSVFKECGVSVNSILQDIKKVGDKRVWSIEKCVQGIRGLSGCHSVEYQEVSGACVCKQ